MSCSAIFFFLFTLQLFVVNTHQSCFVSYCNSTVGTLPIRYPFWKREDVHNISAVCGYTEFGVDCSNSTYSYHPLLRLDNRTYEVKNIDYFGKLVHLVDVATMNTSVVKWKRTNQCIACIHRTHGLNHGLCGVDTLSGHFLCLCGRNKTTPDVCPEPRGGITPTSAPTPARQTARGIDFRLKVGLGVAGGALLLLVVGAVGWVVYRQQHHPSATVSTSSAAAQPEINPPSAMASTSQREVPLSEINFRHGIRQGIQVFDDDEIKAAITYEPENFLGTGGSALLYKGTHPDGRKVAFKMGFKVAKSEWQLKNEIEFLSRLRHRNLIALYGYSVPDHGSLTIFYKYASNGTVRNHLDRSHAKPGHLPWRMRLRIAEEAADALAYLHSCDVIHHDIKTDNFLLDEHFSVKVSDFGLARLLPKNATHLTTSCHGTDGYIDPEYSESGQLTKKSDVFSFGVVLFELISPADPWETEEGRLYTRANNKIQATALHELVDAHIGYGERGIVRQTIFGAAMVASACTEEHGRDRPSMREVHSYLRSLFMSLNVQSQLEIN